MISILIYSFNIMAKMAEGIVSVQDAIIILCLPDTDEIKSDKLSNG